MDLDEDAPPELVNLSEAEDLVEVNTRVPITIVTGTNDIVMREEIMADGNAY